MAPRKWPSYSSSATQVWRKWGIERERKKTTTFLPQWRLFLQTRAAIIACQGKKQRERGRKEKETLTITLTIDTWLPTLLVENKQKWKGRTQSWKEHLIHFIYPPLLFSSGWRFIMYSYETIGHLLIARLLLILPVVIEDFEVRKSAPGFLKSSNILWAFNW